MKVNKRPPGKIELNPPSGERESRPKKKEVRRCLDIFCDWVIIPPSSSRKHKVTPLPTPSPMPPPTGSAPSTSPAGAGETRKSHKVVLRNLFSEQFPSSSLFEDSPLPPSLKEAKSLEDIRTRLDYEPVREKMIQVHDLLPKRGTLKRDELFQQIDRDINGSVFTIDGIAPNDAKSLCSQLMEKTGKSELEILEFMTLLQQGIFATSATQIKKDLGLLDFDDDSEVFVEFSSLKDSKPIYRITTNGENIFLDCSYSKVVNGSVQDSDPELCGILKFSLMISSEDDKAIERWEISSP